MVSGRRRRHPVGDAAAVAAAVEAEHQAGLFRRAAVDEGIDAERPVRADQPRRAALEEFEAGPPHQRAIGENPQVAAGLFDFFFVILGWKQAKALTGPGECGSRNRPDAPAQARGARTTGGAGGAQKRRNRRVIHQDGTNGRRAPAQPALHILVLLVVLASGGWSAFWFYAAGKAQKAIDGWRAREALAGRVYSCGEQTLRGFPFRIEVDCAPFSAAFESGGVAFKLTMQRALAAAQIYQPGLLISEFTGPMEFGETGKPPTLVANWKLAQSSVAGTPTAPKRVALVFDKPMVARLVGDKQENLLSAAHVEIHGRLVGGTVSDKPVIELALSAKQAVLPALGPAAASPATARSWRR